MTDRRKDTSKFVTTWGRLEWSEELQQFVTVEREGYFYDGPWALAHDVTPTWVAEDYQWFDDDGGIGSATALAAENTAVTVAPGTQLRLRGNFGETNAAAGTGEYTAGWTLYYRINTGSWTQLGAASDVRYFDSTHLTNGTAIVVANYVLSWSGGGVQRDWGDECEDGVTISQTWSSDYCEAEWTVDLFNVSAGDTIEFRLRAPDGTSDVAFTSVPTINIAAVVTPPIDTLAITETTPVRIVNETVRPSYYNMRVYSVVGLQFRGITPTINVTAGQQIEEPPAGSLTITEETPTRLVNHIVQPGADSLAITEETPVRVLNDFVVAGAPDALVITEETPDPLLNHIASPALDALVITGLAPQLPLIVSPGLDTLTITEETPDPLLNHIAAPGLDSLIITEETPVRVLNDFVVAGAPDALNLAGNVPEVTRFADPGLDTLAISGIVPQIFVGFLTQPGADTLNLTGLVPLKKEDHVVFPTLDTLSITEETPDPLVNHIAAPALDALIITEETPLRLVNHIVAPAIDTLVITEETPQRLVNHIASPAIDTLVITEETPEVLGANPSPGIDTLTITGLVPQVSASLTAQPGADSLTINSSAPSIGISISVPADSLSITEETPTRLLNSLVAPSSDSLAITGNAPNVLIPHITQPAADSLTFSSSAPIAGSQTVEPTVSSLTLTGLAPQLRGGHEGTAIVNPNATTNVPSNLVICDMTGFKQIPGSLRYTYKGYGVRRKSYEERNPTEYARGGYHREKGPTRPEQDDRFIEDLYPNGVDAEDL